MRRLHRHFDEKWLFAGLFLLFGCDTSSVEVYRVPKEITPALAASVPSSHEITWSVPSGWKSEAATQMRAGSFTAPGQKGRSVDVSIVVLSGQAGGLLANINRWRGQIGLPPLEPNQLDSNARWISPNNRKMLYVNFAHQGKRVAAAVYERGAQTWFFKMTGDDGDVTATEPSFTTLLESVRENTPAALDGIEKATR